MKLDNILAEFRTRLNTPVISIFIPAFSSFSCLFCADGSCITDTTSDQHDDLSLSAACDEVLIKIEGEDGELMTVTSLHVGETEKPPGMGYLGP